jgi:hypothetical protein
VAAGVELLADDRPIAESMPALDAGKPGSVSASWDADRKLQVDASFAP